ncbi:MAG: beta-propeller fold lactonase family protein [Rhodothermia bacterium]|nr:beta-propeller fold lactonase family protein [Rhodothermia bacterium]
MKRLLTITLSVLFAGLVQVPLVAQDLASNLKSSSSESSSSTAAVGFLYTSLNGEGINQVISIERLADGTLGKQTAYSTGSRGGANRKAGGDAAGDFDSQGAIQIIDNNLLVVNAGGNTISVFDLDRKSGRLTHKRNVASGGTRPVSLAFVAKPVSRSEYWVVVGNQWNNPNVQKGGQGEGPIEMYPDAAFHAAGGGHEKVLDERNISLFSFNSRTGVLQRERRLATYPGTNGGPATVAFNHDGTKLAVSTWGIAHFGTATPTHQKPSRVYVYDFDKKTGHVANARFYEEKGVSGSIGFSWDDDTSNLFVSNFNLTVEKRDHSLTVLRDNGRGVKKIAHFGTGNGSDIDEACWTVLNPTGDKLYVSSFGGNLISEFNVDASGNVSKVGGRSDTAFALRKTGTPPGDTKDMFITADGKHMYVLGAYQTFTVSEYSLSNSGSLNLASEYAIAAATERGAGAYNFLGLTGFDR